MNAFLTAFVDKYFVVTYLWNPHPNSDKAFHILDYVMRFLPTVVMNHAVINVGDMKMMT